MPNTYKNGAVKCTSTSAFTIYTCPEATTAIIKSLYISNVNSTADTAATVKFIDASALNIDYSIITQGLVPKQTTLQVVTEPIVLEANDYLTVAAGNANYIEAVVSVLEIT